jgi:hypothetical protein
MTSAEFQEETRALFTDLMMSAPAEFKVSLDRASFDFDHGNAERTPTSLLTLAEMGFTSWHDRARSLADRMVNDEDDDTTGGDSCACDDDDEPEEPRYAGTASDGQTRVYRTTYDRWVKASAFEAVLAQLKAATAQGSLVSEPSAPAA